jgi:hypothetical protein
MKTICRKIYVYTHYLLWAWRKRKDPHIGDIVTFKGEKCFLNQGVAHPYWDLIPLGVEYHTLTPSQKKKYQRVYVRDFQFQPLWLRFGCNFRQDLRFQMTNWFGIDCRQNGKISYRH